MGQIVRLNSKGIKRIIKDTIKDTYALLPNAVLNEVATMDRIPLDEMMTSTVPEKKVVAYLKSGFNFAAFNEFDNKTNYGIVGVPKTGIIQLWVRQGDEDEVIKIMGKLGWICGVRNLYSVRPTRRGYYANEIGLLGLQFEEKYGDDMTQEVFERDYIYHFTAAVLLDKIRKQGLVPKMNVWPLFGGMKDTKGSQYKNVNDVINHGRIFFFLDEPEVKKEGYFEKKFRGNPREMVLLKIDTNKIPQDTKFYRDPKQAGAVYTYSNVPPQAIEVVV